MSQAGSGWNEITKAFKDNTDVAFCDVNLSQDQVRDIHGEQQSPGAGGWPTIRYFNKETGYGGKPYPKKTDKAMCDELGDTSNMQAYVEEMGGTSLCSIETLKGCSDKESKFISKWKPKSVDDVAKELARLDGMQSKDSGSMKPDTLAWSKSRIGILKKLSGGGKKDEL